MPIDSYQRIGAEAIRATGYVDGKLLLEAQVQPNVISAHLFHQLRPGEPVLFHFATEPLTSLVYEFWETGDDQVSPRSWTEIQYLVTSGRFRVDLLYPDQMIADEDPPEQRERVCRSFFPGESIVYPVEVEPPETPN